MYQLNKEQLEYKKKLRNFVDDELIPMANALDASEKFPSEIIKKLGTLGFFKTSFSSPEDTTCGNAIETVILFEELSRGLTALGLILAPHFQGIALLASYASDTLRSSYLDAAFSGDVLFSYAITEESGGTNALDISTTATKNGDSWILNGKKCWVTNAGIADGYFILAQTAIASKRRSLSFFFVEKGTPGLVFKKKEKMIGCSNSIMGTIELNQCSISLDHLIGTENEGYMLMKQSLNHGRLAIAAAAIGTAHRALELCIHYASWKEFYGRKLYSHQGISFPIAEMYAEISACKNMLYHTAGLCDLKESFTADAAALKILANTTCMQICQKSQEIHGAFGLSKDSEIERCLRDSHMLSTAEGTLSACKMTVSSALLNSDLNLYF